MSIAERGFDSSFFQEDVARSSRRKYYLSGDQERYLRSTQNVKNNSYSSKLPLITPFAVVRYTRTNYTNFPEQKTESRNEKAKRETRTKKPNATHQNRETRTEKQKSKKQRRETKVEEPESRNQRPETRNQTPDTRIDCNSNTVTNIHALNLNVLL